MNKTNKRCKILIKKMDKKTMKSSLKQENKEFFIDCLNKNNLYKIVKEINIHKSKKTTIFF